VLQQQAPPPHPQEPVWPLLQVLQVLPQAHPLPEQVPCIRSA
jgi:hypothetical protein